MKKTSMEDSLAVSFMSHSGQETLYSFLKSKWIQVHDINKVIRTLAELINNLNQLGLYHGDISSTSVIISKNDEVNLQYIVQLCK